MTDYPDHKSRRGDVRTISATDAAKTFGRLVDVVRETAAPCIVERGGVPVVEIRPAPRPALTRRGLAALLRTLPSAGDDFARAVETGRARLNRRAVPKNAWAR